MDVVINDALLGVLEDMLCAADAASKGIALASELGGSVDVSLHMQKLKDGAETLLAHMNAVDPGARLH